MLKLSHFSLHNPEFLDFLNDFYLLNSSFSSWTILEFIELSVFSHISLGFFQIITFSFFFFFFLSVCSQTSIYLGSVTGVVLHYFGGVIFPSYF